MSNYFWIYSFEAILIMVVFPESSFETILSEIVLLFTTSLTPLPIIMFE